MINLTILNNGEIKINESNNSYVFYIKNNAVRYHIAIDSITMQHKCVNNLEINYNDYLINLSLIDTLEIEIETMNNNLNYIDEEMQEDYNHIIEVLTTIKQAITTANINDCITFKSLVDGEILHGIVEKIVIKNNHIIYIVHHPKNKNSSMLTVTSKEVIKNLK